MSPLLIGKREYSHDKANRTIFLTIVSTPLAGWVCFSGSDAVEAPSSSLSSRRCTLRRRVGDSEAEDSGSSRCCQASCQHGPLFRILDHGTHFRAAFLTRWCHDLNV